MRVASDGDQFYIDLGDPGWHAVRITGGGWSVVQSPPVRFRRTPDMRALPFPERGTPITALREFLPNVSEGDFTLIVAVLLAILQPRGPYPVFVAIGEHGAAKTTLLRIMRALTDPSRVMTAPLPSSGRDLFIACLNSHVQAFENVSELSDAMSDHLCRISTGAGMRTRKFFTNADETLFVARARPITMEGIGSFISRPDLLDRSIVLSLAPLRHRKTEGALWAEFDRRKAGIFGALCDMLVSGVRQFPEIHLVNPPRMADFATWAVACGLDTFEAAFSQNRQHATDVILDEDVLAQSIKALVAEKGQWRGTAMELLTQIGPAARITLPKVLSERLSRLAPALRSHGICVSHEPRSANRREITIARIEQ